MVESCLAKARWLAGHSIAGDITELAEAGVRLPEEWIKGERVLDSLLLARMEDENDLSYELENLVTSRFDVEPWKYETEPFNWIKEKNEAGRAVKRRSVDARRWPADLRRKRCARDAWAARLLVEDSYDRAKQHLVEYTQRTANVLERLNVAGAVVDLPKFNALDVSLGQQLAEARDKLVKAAALAGVEGFSPTNDSHIRELLYEKLSLPKLNKTAKGLASVDKNTLKQLEHDVVRLLLDYNKLDKLYTVNVDGLRGLIHGESELGYLPFRINPLGARTGRRASSNPNSQNWPETVRGLITSRFGVDGRIINADYSKLEVVLIAWVAGDEKLLSAFTGGKGYIDVAKELFGFDVVNGTPQYTAVKSIVLGVHYNMQTPKMARQLALLGVRFSADWNEHEAETDRLRKLYLSRYAGIGRYMTDREARWLRTGMSDSYVGRVRHLPVPARGESGYGHSLNQAINFPIQSLASDVTASALMDFESEMLALAGMSYSQWLDALIEQRRNFLTKGVKSAKYIPVSQLFNEVHDSLVADLFPDTAKRDTDCLIDCMKSVRSLKKLAPGFDNSILNADWKISTHWKSK